MIYFASPAEVLFDEKGQLKASRDGLVSDAWTSGVVGGCRKRGDPICCTELLLSTIYLKLLVGKSNSSHGPWLTLGPAVGHVETPHLLGGR